MRCATFELLKITQLYSLCKLLSPAFLDLGTFIISRIPTRKSANSRVPHPEKPIGDPLSSPS